MLTFRMKINNVHFVLNNARSVSKTQLIA